MKKLKVVSLHRIFVLAICVSFFALPLSVTAKSNVAIKWEFANDVHSAHLRDIIRNQSGVYVAVGNDSSIMASPNGTDWSRASVPTSVVADLFSVATNGNSFIAVGSRGALLISSDGTNWRTSSVAVNYTLGDIVPKSDRSGFEANWSKRLTQNDLILEDVVWDGSRYVAVGIVSSQVKKARVKSYSGRSKGIILTSSDGLAWKQAPLISKGSGDRHKLLWNGKQYYVFTGWSTVGEDFEYKSVSITKDFKSWKEVAFNFTKSSIRDIAYNGKAFVAVTGLPNTTLEKSSDRTYIYSSPDAVKWTEYKFNQPKVVSLNSVIWDGSRFIAADNKRGTIIGFDFAGNASVQEYGYYNSAEDGSAGRSAVLNKLYWDGKQTIGIGDYGYILSSTNLKNWMALKEPMSADLLSIASSNGRYVASGWNNTLLESADGKVWSRSQPLQGTAGNIHEKVVGNNGVFLSTYKSQFFSFIKQQTVKISEQEGVWKVYDDTSEVPVQLQRKLFGEGVRHQKVVKNGNILLGVPFKTGEFSDIFQKDVAYEVSKDNGVTWTKTNHIGKGHAVAAGNGKFVDFVGTQAYTSTDGVNWKKGDDLGAKDNYLPARLVTSLASNGHVFMATSELTFNASGTNEGYSLMWVSKDGVSWDTLSVPTTSTINQVIGDGASFIAVGDGGTILVGIE
ncbi:hypothetical protein [Cohnella soli]|uniref:Uncharacterized protein n=1 Tax=Cohnella soli TaxID=425005 RepID=A0ABW0I349_9BACL